MSTYTSLTDDDLRVMLAAIGAESVEELFAGICLLYTSPSPRD